MKQVKKRYTPLVDCLENYAKAKNLRMHMPCHVGRLGFLPSAERIDITELGFNDNLNSPDGVIAQAQQAYASLFDAQQAIFLTNGSTQGNVAFLSLMRGKKVLVPTNSHVSVKRGAKLFGVELVFAKEISLQTVEEAIKVDKVDGVLAQYPDYFGNIIPLREIYELTKESDVKLFVDSAHGAHFGLTDKLPSNAVNFCDACVVSTHKTLGAYTQTAVILTNDTDLAKRIKKAVNLISSTSPSYLLLASMDYARDYAERFGKQRLDKLYDNLQKFYRQLPQGVKVIKNEDFCKLYLDFADLGASGKTAFEFFEKQGIFAELYKETKVLFYLGLFISQKDLNKLLKATRKLAVQKFDDKEQKEQFGPFEYGEEL